jgi:hypothetical protein
MTVLRRPIALTFPILAVLFLGGGIAGLVYAQRIAPDSGLAVFAGVLALPAAFVAGMQLWLGLALFAVFAGSARRLLGGRPQARPPVNVVPPGAIAFVFTSLATCLLAGLVLGAVATSGGFLSTFATVFSVGVVYGVLCWLLARNGFLPFPE